MFNFPQLFCSGWTKYPAVMQVRPKITMTVLPVTRPLTMGAGQSVKIGEEIGKGAYGTVHKGTYQGKPVAIKRIHQLLLENARYNRSDYDHVQQEFIHECDLLASLEHPHVVKFIGVFEVKGDKALERLFVQEERCRDGGC